MKLKSKKDTIYPKIIWYIDFFAFMLYHFYMASIRKAKSVNTSLKTLDKKDLDKVQNLTNSLLSIQKSADSSREKAETGKTEIKPAGNDG